MSLKTEFMKITTYQEYDKRREEFRYLDVQDSEVRNHLQELFPTLDNSGFENGIITELSPKPRQLDGGFS